VPELAAVAAPVAAVAGATPVFGVDRRRPSDAGVALVGALSLSGLRSRFDGADSNGAASSSSRRPNGSRPARRTRRNGDPPMTPPRPDAPLAGVRVLDMTNVLAGPFCAYHLAALGADVVKVEEPRSGDLARALGADPELNRRGMGASFLAQNAGKRSLAVDLKHPDGVAAFLRLVDTADVVVENFRPGVMRRLGLGYEVLAARRPKLVYAAISGFGASGPLRDQPAYDQIVQGYAGVMSVTGDAHSAPLRAGFPVSDTVGGLTAAMAIASALLGAERTGRGCAIDVSMLEATLITLGWAVSNYLTAGVAPTPMGNDNMTASPSGTFRTGDGLLNVAANQQRQFETLCRVIGRPELVPTRASPSASPASGTAPS
jgi:CoA:oxalate CoA-transferase